MQKFTLAAAALLIAAPTIAADVAAPTFPLQRKATPCTLQECSGWYVGADIIGGMSAATADGTGGSSGILAGGSAIGVHGGYQFWNGQYFAALEAGIGYQTPNKGATESLGSNRLVGLELVKLGYGLGGVLGQAQGAPATPSQAPTAIPLPASLSQALIAPYVVTGAMQRNGQSQSVSGVGSEFLLSQGVNLSIDYLYAPPMNGNGSNNLIRLGLNRKF